MIADKCPHIGRIGRIKSIVELFQRLFDLGNLSKKRRMTIEKPSTPKRILSNAGYHLTFEQVLGIIDACSRKRDRVLIETLAFTGMRRAEATALAVEDILWDKKLLLIRHGKGDKQRLVPISNRLSKSLLGLTGDRTSGPMFQSRRERHLSVRQVNRIVAKAGVDAGIDNPNPRYRNITCHLFRHTFARLWKNQQGSIETLSAVLGHQSVRTTWDVYGKESLEDIKHNYQKMIGQMFADSREK